MLSRIELNREDDVNFLTKNKVQNNGEVIIE